MSTKAFLWSPSQMSLASKVALGTKHYLHIEDDNDDQYDDNFAYYMRDRRTRAN